MSGDAGAFPECVGNTLITPDRPPSRCAVLGRVEPELVGLPGKAKHGTPREGSGSLSMQPVGCTPWCSTDALAGVVGLKTFVIRTVCTGDTSNIDLVQKLPVSCVPAKTFSPNTSVIMSEIKEESNA